MKYLKKKNIIWYFTKQLSNLNFSIIMLLLIAFISIIGTIIEQDQNFGYYQLNYPIKHNLALEINWKTISYFGLDHIYATWWFLLLLTLFFCSLITCTFSRQLPGLRNARNWKFKQKPFNKKYTQTIKICQTQALSNIIYSLNSKQYYVFHKQNHIYAYKGLIGRIAPIFVHISIILTLTGSIIGLFGGFMAQQMVPNGEIFHIQNTIKSGLKSYLPKNMIGRIDNFYIEYHKDKSIKQFYSYISLLNNQGEYITRKKIYVNSPLRFNGITFYQTDWQINALRIKIGAEDIIQQKLQKTNVGNTTIWIYQLPINKDNNITCVITNLKEKILLYNSTGKFIKSIDINEKIKINNNYFSITEIMTSTGLQIKTDPGITFVYTGFLILIISIGMSYLSYSQIWIYSPEKELHMTGITNRGKLSFEEDLINIQKNYIKSTCKIKN